MVRNIERMTIRSFSQFTASIIDDYPIIKLLYTKGFRVIEDEDEFVHFKTVRVRSRHGSNSSNKLREKPIVKLNRFVMARAKIWLGYDLRCSYEHGSYQKGKKNV